MGTSTLQRSLAYAQTFSTANPVCLCENPTFSPSFSSVSYACANMCFVCYEASRSASCISDHKKHETNGQHKTSTHWDKTYIGIDLSHASREFLSDVRLRLRGLQLHEILLGVGYLRRAGYCDLQLAKTSVQQTRTIRDNQKVVGMCVRTNKLGVTFRTGRSALAMRTP